MSQAPLSAARLFGTSEIMQTSWASSSVLTLWPAVMQEELMEVVDFFLKPQRFRRSGAKIPRGVLLCGPPGPLTLH